MSSEVCPASVLSRLEASPALSLPLWAGWALGFRRCFWTAACLAVLGAAESVFCATTNVASAARLAARSTFFSMDFICRCWSRSRAEATAIRNVRRYEGEMRTAKGTCPLRQVQDTKSPRRGRKLGHFWPGEGDAARRVSTGDFVRYGA